MKKKKKGSSERKLNLSTRGERTSYGTVREKPIMYTSKRLSWWMFLKWLTKQVLASAFKQFLLAIPVPRITFPVRENAWTDCFSVQNLLLHASCDSTPSIFCFQRLHRFVKYGQIILGHLSNLCDWVLSCEWWLSEGRTGRAPAAGPRWPQNVIRNRIGLIVLDSFLCDYGRCRPPTALHLLAFT